MTRIIAFLFGVLAIGAGLAWLADRPGTVSIVWQGYRIETSAMALMLGILLITAGLVLIWQIYRAVVGAPSSIADYFRGRRRIKGYEALSQGMIAVGAGDARFATQQAKQARKLLENEPLVGLLTAQAAQLSGNEDGAREAFEGMLDKPETLLLGLHGLFVEAERQGQHAAARQCAAEAVRRAPGLAWAAEADFDFKVGDGDWKAALTALERNEQNRLLSKSEARRKRAVLLTAQAMDLEDSNAEQALELALDAHRLVPELVPAAMVAGRTAGGLGKMSQGSGIIEKTWKLAPHPDLADIYAHLRSGDTTRDRLKRVRALVKKLPNHPEARIALARAAIDASEWATARKALESLVDDDPSRRVCVMMAQIEDGEHGDRGKVREWLARAVRAPRDPAWVADGQISDEWAPVTPVSRTLDGYEWAVPNDDGGAVPADVLAALGAAEPEDAPMIEVQAAMSQASPAAGSVNEAAQRTAMDETADAKGGKGRSGDGKAAGSLPTGPDSQVKDTTEDEKGSSGKSSNPMSRGMKRAMEAGAIAPSKAEAEKSAADDTAGQTAEKPKTTPAKTTQAKATKTKTGEATSKAKPAPVTVEPGNGRHSGPESVAGVAVAAQENVDDIPSPLFRGQPDDPGPVSDSDEPEADKRKWTGMFN